MCAQQEHEQSEDALRQRLHEVRLRRDNERHGLHEMEAKVASLMDEMARARKGETRYRRKVRRRYLDMDSSY